MNKPAGKTKFFVVLLVFLMAGSSAPVLDGGFFDASKQDSDIQYQNAVDNADGRLSVIAQSYDVVLGSRVEAAESSGPSPLSVTTGRLYPELKVVRASDEQIKIIVVAGRRSDIHVVVDGQGRWQRAASLGSEKSRGGSQSAPPNQIASLLEVGDFSFSKKKTGALPESGCADLSFVRSQNNLVLRC